MTESSGTFVEEGREVGLITMRDTAKREAATGYGNVESANLTIPEPKTRSHAKNVKRLIARMQATNLLAILSVIFWTTNVRI